MDNFHFSHLIVEKLDVFNFHPIFPIALTNFTLTYQIWTHFFKKYIKSGNITVMKKKTLKGFWYFLILKWRQNWKNWTQWRVYNYVERRTDLLECHVAFVFPLSVITSGCYEPKLCSKFLTEITSRKCVFYFWTSVSISFKSSLKLSGVILKKRLYSSSSSNQSSCNKVVPTPIPLAYFS